MSLINRKIKPCSKFHSIAMKQFKTLAVIAASLCCCSFSQIAIAQPGNYLGNLSANPYLPPAPPAVPGTFNNPYGNSANSPQLYDSQGNFRGNLNSNPYDPDSVANPYAPAKPVDIMIGEITPPSYLTKGGKAT